VRSKILLRPFFPIRSLRLHLRLVFKTFLTKIPHKIMTSGLGPSPCPSKPHPHSHVPSDQASGHFIQPSARMLPLEAHTSLPPADALGASSNFGAIRSMGTSARYSPHQNLVRFSASRSSASRSSASQSSASRLHPRRQSATTSAKTSSSGNINMSIPFDSALSGSGEAINAWRDLVKDAPPYQAWKNLLGDADRTAGAYISAWLTKALVYGHSPTRQQFGLSARTLFDSVYMVKKFALLATQKYTQYLKTNILESWIETKPQSNFPAGNVTKRAWVSMNAYLARLSAATMESFSKQAGDAVEHMRDLSNKMVSNALIQPAYSGYRSLQLGSAESFKLVHTFGEGHAQSITAFANLGVNEYHLISYYGNSVFRATAVEMIRPFFAYLPYVSNLHNYAMLLSLLSIPAAMVYFLFFLFS
jgi:hypothetical protein